MSAVNDLIARGDQLFGARGNLMSFWQTIGEHFHPMRADFTRQWNDGDEFASGSMSSYPFLVHRELSNAVSSMLRPTNQQWMTVTVDREDQIDHEGKRWLEWATETQTRAMYDPAAKFVRATKMGDGDYMAFGQCVILGERDPNRNTLLYSTHHLRDTVWNEDYSGTVDEVHRNWNPKLGQLAQLFKGNLHRNLESKVDKEPFRNVTCRHVVLPVESWDGEIKYKVLNGEWSSMPQDPKIYKFVSIHLDLENKAVLEAVPLRRMSYIIPRWAHHGTQYAYSPAVVIGLPEARLIQAMALTLLEAGETAVRPPMLQRSEVLRNDAQLYAGGLTSVDKEYDERLGEALRPLYEANASGIGYGIEMLRDSRFQLAEAFYINKLSLPPPDREMTAYEAGLRTQQWIQQSLPLFEPLETEYNSALCDWTFWTLYDSSAFGPLNEKRVPITLPESLQGAEIDFMFESPLRRALEKQKVSKFEEMVNLILVAGQVDKNAAMLPDVTTALRDAIEANATPMDWLRNEEQFAQMVEQAQQEAQAQQLAQSMTMAGAAAEQVGKGMQAVRGEA